MPRRAMLAAVPGLVLLLGCTDPDESWHAQVFDASAYPDAPPTEAAPSRVVVDRDGAITAPDGAGTAVGGGPQIMNSDGPPPSRPPPDGPPAPPPPPGTIPLDRMPTELARAVCAKIFGCCRPDQIRRLGITTDAEGCPGAFEPLLRSMVPPIAQSVSRGRLVYHGELLGPCLERYRNSGCGEVLDFFDLITRCRMLEARQMPGQVCTEGHHLECIDGFCSQVAQGAGFVCVEKKGAGQRCSEDVQCASGACLKGDQICSTPRPPEPLCPQ